jgi:hypothetical protein
MRIGFRLMRTTTRVQTPISRCASKCVHSAVFVARSQQSLTHSSGLWFQMLGVEAHSSFPYDQNDRGFLAKVSRAISGLMPLATRAA